MNQLLAVYVLFQMTCAASAGWAQDAPVSRQTLIPDRLSCVSCRIKMNRIVRLHDNDQGLIPGAPPQVIGDSKGRFWLVGAAVPVVFSRDGRLNAVIGRKGSGPNEFRLVSGIAELPGDSVVVVDNMNSRLTVLTPALVVHRTIPIDIGVINSIRVLKWPTAVLINSDVATADRVGWPLHLASIVDKIALRRSFGLDAGEKRTIGPFDFLHVLSTPRRLEVWSAEVLQYRVARWSADGRLQEQLIRKPKWFSKRSEYRLGNHRTPPPPRILAIEADEYGRLWIFIAVAAREWREAWANIPTSAREAPVSKIDIEKLYCTVVEVLDPEAKAVIARTTLDGFVVGALPNRRAAIFRIADDKSPIIDVVQFDVQNR
ncbi:MAG: hypothetical protein ACT443_06910 [Gemmatimonadota bacterium]